MKMGTALSSRREYLDAVAGGSDPGGRNRKWETGQLRKYDVSSDQYLVFVLQDHLNICGCARSRVYGSLIHITTSAASSRARTWLQHLEHECLNRPKQVEFPTIQIVMNLWHHRPLNHQRSFVSDDENEVPEGKARPRITSLEDAFAKAPDMEGKIIDPSSVDPRPAWASWFDSKGV